MNFTKTQENAARLLKLITDYNRISKEYKDCWRTENWNTPYGINILTAAANGERIVFENSNNDDSVSNYLQFDYPPKDYKIAPKEEIVELRAGNNKYKINLTKAKELGLVETI